MATPAEITELRQLINDNTDPYEFTAPELSAHIDGQLGDVRKAAGVVWSIRASKLAGLVDVTEGSSSRKLSQGYKQALEMAAFYGGDTSSGGSTRTRTRPIVRPTA